MKIMQENPDLITMQDLNLTGFFMGILFLMAGSGVFYLSAIAQSTENNALGAVVGAVFALVGMYIVLTTKIINIRLDRAAGRCSFSVWKLPGAESMECSIKEIKELTLERFITTTGSGRRQAPGHQYVLKFVLQNGRELPFEFGVVRSGVDILGPSAHERKMEEAKLIAGFLGVRLNEINTPPPLETMSAVISEAAKQGKLDKI